MRCPHCNKLISDSPDGLQMHYRKYHRDQPIIINRNVKTEDEKYLAVQLRAMADRGAKHQAKLRNRKG